MELPISKIKTNPYNTREELGDLDGLKSSIRQYGLIAPIIVRENGGSYEALFGSRRLRAISELGIKSVEVDVRDISNEDMAIISVIENVHRKDLRPLELAYAYRRGMDSTKLDEKGFSEVSGESVNKIRDYLRILELPNRILDRADKYTAIQLISLSRLHTISSGSRIMLENALAEREINSNFLREIVRCCESVNSSNLPVRSKKHLYGEIILQDYSNLPADKQEDIRGYANSLMHKEISRYNERLRKTENARQKPKVVGKKPARCSLTNRSDEEIDLLAKEIRKLTIKVDTARRHKYYVGSSKGTKRRFRQSVSGITSSLEKILNGTRR